MTHPAHQALLKRLENWLLQFPGVAIAYSGGMDSGFLALAASKFVPGRSLALLASTEVMGRSEVALATRLAHHFSLPLKVVDLSVLDLDVFRNHPPDRCYHCKKAVFTELLKQVPAGWVLCDGSNTDDLDDFRPGHRALRELGIKSPLVEADFDKETIRQLLAEWHAREFIRPAQACLATRIPFGTPVTRADLDRIEEGEQILGEAGFAGARLRVHGDIARIEIPPAQLPDALRLLSEKTRRLKALGFQFITLDLDGYQKGSMNKPNDTEEKTPENS